jgi:hypothetical protein
MIVAINHIYVDGRCAMKPKPATLGAKYVEQFRDAAIAAVHRKRPPYPEATFTVHRELLPTHNRTVLDLGTGSGEIAIPMAGYAHIVHVVEPSDALRKIAAGLPARICATPERKPHSKSKRWSGSMSRPRSLTIR